MSVKDATTNFDRFVGLGSHYLLPLNFFWFLRRYIVGWTIVIVLFTGPKCWNKLPVGLRDLSVGPETFARHLKTHLFRAGFSDWARILSC